MRQVFVPREWIDLQKKEAILVDDPFHHLVHVLRKKTGDWVQAFDGQGKIYRARITEVLHDKAVLEIADMHEAQAGPKFFLTLGAAILKGKKMNFLVQKATEVGVHTLVPLVTKRTIGAAGKAGPDKAEKWQKVAVEAAKQCGRAFVPNIHHPILLEEFLEQTADFDAKLIAWEAKAGQPQGHSLKLWAAEALEQLKSLSMPVHALVLVGPEGGFEPGEAQRVVKRGFHPFGLGPTILRSETAAIVASVLVGYELEHGL